MDRRDDAAYLKALIQNQNSFIELFLYRSLVEHGD